MITKDSKVQDFIEQYYPNYHACKWITEEQDLYKIITGEYKEGDSSHQLLVEKYGGDLYSTQLQADHYQVHNDILQGAIQGYINSII